MRKGKWRLRTGKKVGKVDGLYKTGRMNMEEEEGA